MRNKFLIGILLFVFVFSLTNLSVYANTKKKVHLEGNVSKNEPVYDVIIFVPDEKQSNSALLIESSSFNTEKIKDLKISDYNGPRTNKQRFSKVTALMFTGGLSVTHSIEKSIDKNQADNKLSDNFLKPVKSLKAGWKSDDNPMFTNYIGHPLLWFLVASDLKASGASDKEAIIMSQAINFFWEYLVEGNYVHPSPKDLAMDTLGGLSGVYLYNVVLNKHMNATYNKLAAFGEKKGIDFMPEITYNPDTRGMIFAAKIKIKK